MSVKIDDKIIYVKLEYKPDKGYFHINRHLNEEDSFGYLTICKEILYDLATDFTQSIHKKYNLGERPISLTKMKDEFEMFLKS